MKKWSKVPFCDCHVYRKAKMNANARAVPNTARLRDRNQNRDIIRLVIWDPGPGSWRPRATPGIFGTRVSYYPGDELSGNLCVRVMIVVFQLSGLTILTSVEFRSTWKLETGNWKYIPLSNKKALKMKSHP